MSSGDKAICIVMACFFGMASACVSLWAIPATAAIIVGIAFAPKDES